MVGIAVWYDVDENKVTNLETQPLAKYLDKAKEITDWINTEMKEKMTACLESIDAITPVLTEWIANDGKLPEPEPEAEEPPAEEAPAAYRYRFKSKSTTRQDDAPCEGDDCPPAEDAKPQDVIKPVTDLVEAAYELLDGTFNEISEQLNKFKKETFRMEKEIGLKKKKSAKIGDFKTKRMLYKKSNLNQNSKLTNKNNAIELKLEKALEIKHKL